MSEPAKPLILVIDDEDDIRSSLKMILEYEGLRMVEAANGPEGLKAMAAHSPDAILLDIKMPRMDGLEVLAEIRKRSTSLPVVMISGHGTIATAIDATRLGAFDFMQKPLERDRVLLVLRNAVEQSRLRQENSALRRNAEGSARMVGRSAALDTVKDSVAKAAPTTASVLITGDSGTGKELVARAIHRNSARADQPFVKVNCAAIPEELIESELFGHVKGSFTGASKDQVGKFVRADGGTIFLDEVGDMSLKTQAKVLRVLQDGDVEPVGAAESRTVDVRVVAATNKDLAAEIEANRFREDLYFRLNVVPIHLPSLRSRPEDIDELVEYFTESFCSLNDFRPKRFSKEALAILRSQPWRGNIRELRNAVERLLIMSPGDIIQAADIPQGLGLALGEQADSAPDGVLAIPYKSQNLQTFKDAAERAYLLKKLEESDWNIAATAKLIETPRSNLYKKLEAYDLSRDKDR